MLSNLFTVAQQVLVLFILIIAGVILEKTSLVSEKGIHTLANIVLFAVTPCVIIEAFQRDFDSSMFKELVLSFVISFVILLLSVVFVELMYRKKNTDRIVVLKFAVVFSNAGYMGLPMQRAILGEEGVFFGAAFVAMFNLFAWTYGLIIMSGKKEIKSMLKGIVNPGVIGTVIAFILYVLNIRLPDIIALPISHMAVLNTPLPMLIIGFYLARANLKQAFKKADVYISQLFRLLIIPLVFVFALGFLGISTPLYVAMIISVSAPTAVATVMMSTRYNRDTSLSASIVSASNLFSIITMPVMVALAQTLRGGM